MAIALLAAILAVPVVAVIGTDFPPLAQTIDQRMQIHELGLSSVSLLLAIIAPVLLLARLFAPLVLPPFHHLEITHRGVSYRRITGRQVCPWAEQSGFGVLLRMNRFFTWRGGYTTTTDWFVVGGLGSGGPLHAPDSDYPLEIDVRVFSAPFADQQQVATEMALWFNELATAVAEGRLPEGVALPAILSGYDTAIKGATPENDAEVRRAEAEAAGTHLARMASAHASNARAAAATPCGRPSSINIAPTRSANKRRPSGRSRSDWLRPEAGLAT